MIITFAHAAGVGVEFDPNVVTVDEGSVGSVCANITNGTIDRAVSITFNVLRDTGTASNSEYRLAIYTRWPEGN